MLRNEDNLNHFTVEVPATDYPKTVLVQNLMSQNKRLARKGCCSKMPYNVLQIGLEMLSSTHQPIMTNQLFIHEFIGCQTYSLMLNPLLVNLLSHHIFYLGVATPILFHWLGLCLDFAVPIVCQILNKSYGMFPVLKNTTEASRDFLHCSWHGSSFHCWGHSIFNFHSSTFSSRHTLIVLVWLSCNHKW